MNNDNNKNKNKRIDVLIHMVDRYLLGVLLDDDNNGNDDNEK